jgi:hypothetical protein
MSRARVQSLTEQARREMRSSIRRWTQASTDPPVTVQAKMLRLELLQMKADLEREPEHLVLDYSDADVPSLGGGARRDARTLGAPRADAARPLARQPGRGVQWPGEARLVAADRVAARHGGLGMGCLLGAR